MTDAEALLARMDELGRTQDEIKAEVAALKAALQELARTCRRHADESEHESGRWLMVAHAIEEATRDQ